MRALDHTDPHESRRWLALYARGAIAICFHPLTRSELRPIVFGSMATTYADPCGLTLW
jgi:hypothetical protein